LDAEEITTADALTARTPPAEWAAAPPSAEAEEAVNTAQVRQRIKSFGAGKDLGDRLSEDADIDCFIFLPCQAGEEILCAHASSLTKEG
jgi:hypothetical protein